MAIIQKNEYAIRQMNAQTANTPSSVATAESMIQDMKQKLENLIETSLILNKEYIRYKTKNYLTISFEERSLADELSIKWVDPGRRCHFLCTLRAGSSPRAKSYLVIRTKRNEKF